MIIEAILNALVTLVEVIFGWISLPAFPEGLSSAITTIEDLTFSSATCLTFFVRLSTVKVLVPLVIVVVNFDRIWRFTLFVLRKIPFFGVQ